jgi:hypothetical protein
MKIKFRNFTKPNLLKRINRNLLTRFFAQFNGLSLPPPALSDHDYFNALARLLMSPESLPEPLTEALFAIDEMSCANAQAQLEFSPEWPALQSQLAPESTPEEIALQIWLLAPELLAGFITLSASAASPSSSISPPLRHSLPLPRPRIPAKASRISFPASTDGLR